MVKTRITLTINDVKDLQRRFSQEINTSKVIVKHVFLHNAGSSFAYLTLLNCTMTIWIACLSALHLI